jgi:hypothetical protein
MGGDERASKAIAKDSYFITLVGHSGILVNWHTETCEEARRLYYGEYVTYAEARKTSNLVATSGTKVSAFGI